MKQGYGVFGKAYKVMLENDVHDIHSIDHRFKREMILLEEESYEFLYSTVKRFDVHGHELFAFAQQFKGESEIQTIENILKFTTDIVRGYNVEFRDMHFGGTEKQILERGTDWCADMARVGAVLTQCCGIPCRILTLANPEKAYNGHVICEAYYENHYGVVDFLCGVLFYEERPISAYELLKDQKPLERFPEEYQGYYNAIAINEYDPMDPRNDYSISRPNQYTLDLIYKEHGNEWFMGEDD